MLMLVMDSEVLPTLLRVTTCGALTEPMASRLNVSLEGDKLAVNKP